MKFENSQDNTSTHYKTVDMGIENCIQYITKIPHSGLTRDVNAHYTLWHSYTDSHRRQLITDLISNSDHITLHTDTPTRLPNTTLQQTSSPDITTMSNVVYRRASWRIQIIVNPSLQTVSSAVFRIRVMLQRLSCLITHQSRNDPRDQCYFSYSQEMYTRTLTLLQSIHIQCVLAMSQVVG